MTIKELKEELGNFPDEMEVMTLHFGVLKDQIKVKRAIILTENIEQ